MPFARLLLLNFTLAAYLTGVIWVVQLVTYPALALVGKPEFTRYHAAHSRGMGWVVGAPMVLELALAGWLAWAAYPAGARGWPWGSWRWCCWCGQLLSSSPCRFITSWRPAATITLPLMVSRAPTGCVRWPGRPAPGCWAGGCGGG